MRNFWNLIFAILLLGWSTTTSSAKTLIGTPIDEGYRAEFGQCDKHNKFKNVQFPIENLNTKKTIWYGCKTDPSKFERFEALNASEQQAVLVSSKLGHDEDGSQTACGAAKGPTDQCPTSLMLDASAKTPCVLPTNNKKRCVPVDADVIPYVVIPSAAPKGIKSREFTQLTKVSVGDYAVVIANGKVIPAIVADEGPAYKIGEGSTALLKSLSTDGKARTVSAGVLFVFFPGTADTRSSLVPEKLGDTVKTKATAYYGKLR